MVCIITEMSIHAVGEYNIHLNYVGHISPFYIHIIVFSRDLELDDLIEKRGFLENTMA